MKKIIIGLSLVLLIAIGAVSYYVFTNLDDIVKAAIEKHGSEATKTSVKVGSVKISLKEGSGAIYNITVANPKGFGDPNAFSLGEVSTKVNYESVSKEIIIIDDITVLAPQVFFKMNQDKETNLNILKNNLTSGVPASSSTKSESTPSGGEQPKLIIRRVSFAEGNIQATVVPLNSKVYQLKLPAIEMKDLGGKNGALPAEIAKQILNELTGQAKTAIKQQGFFKDLEKLKDQAQQKIDEEKAKLKGHADSKIEAEKQKATDKLKGLLGR